MNVLTNEINEEMILKKYGEMMPFCKTLHPTTKKTCRQEYADSLAHCYGCVQTTKLIDTLINYEKLKESALVHIAACQGEARNVSLEELKYYATSEL